MRSSTAIALVLLGGGVITTAVALPRNCNDPATGQPISCGGSGPGWTHYGGFSSIGHISSAAAASSSASSVSRGGFGGAGAAATASAGS
jgi:hypothetical protein